jgi:uridine phosphorylase
MPPRLRPTAPIAADAVLVGDPGRALLLAQELLGRPRMSNHARGLWGYSGRAKAGRELTIQSTGMGGPSAAVVLSELAALGVKRAIRVGTCLAAEDGPASGEVVVVGRAIAEGGSAASFGLEVGDTVEPDRRLTGRLREELGGEGVTVASLDLQPEPGAKLPAGAEAADMQTVAVLARAAELGVAAAALLVVAERGADAPLADEPLAEAAKRAGEVAAAVLSA